MANDRKAKDLIFKSWESVIGHSHYASRPSDSGLVMDEQAPHNLFCFVFYSKFSYSKIFCQVTKKKQKREKIVLSS